MTTAPSTADEQQVVISADPSSSSSSHTEMHLASSPSFVLKGQAVGTAIESDLASDSSTLSVVSSTTEAGSSKDDSDEPSSGAPAFVSESSTPQSWLKSATSTSQMQDADHVKAQLNKQLVECANRLAIRLQAAEDHETWMQIADTLAMIKDYMTKVDEGLVVQIGSNQYNVYNSVTRFDAVKFDDAIAALKAQSEQ